MFPESNPVCAFPGKTGSIPLSPPVQPPPLHTGSALLVWRQSGYLAPGCFSLRWSHLFSPTTQTQQPQTAHPTPISRGLWSGLPTLRPGHSEGWGGGVPRGPGVATGAPSERGEERGRWRREHSQPHFQAPSSALLWSSGGRSLGCLLLHHQGGRDGACHTVSFPERDKGTTCQRVLGCPVAFGGSDRLPGSEGLRVDLGCCWALGSVRLNPLRVSRPPRACFSGPRQPLLPLCLPGFQKGSPEQLQAPGDGGPPPPAPLQAQPGPSVKEWGRWKFPRGPADATSGLTHWKRAI